ncbi:MFS transporter [Oxalobacteraceae bacterium A2-2]
MSSPAHVQAVDLPPPIPAPAPTLQAWLAVLSVAVGAFALVTSEFLPVGLLPAIAAELGVTEGMAGLLVTAPGLVATFAAVFVTVGVGKTDRRYVVAGLTLLLLVSNVIVGLADSFIPVLIGRSLLGVGVGGFWAIAGALGTRLVPAEYATRATSLIFAGVSVGTVAGVPAGALLGELYGWRAAFGAASAIAVLVLLTQLWLLPSVPGAAAVRLRDLPQLLRVQKARLGLLATLLVFVGQFAAYTYVTPFLSQVSGMGAKAISALLLAYGAAGFIGNLVGGWAVARSVRASLIATGAILGGSTLLLPLLGTHPALAAVLVVVWGLGFGMMPISVQTWIFKAAPDAMESGGALFVAIAQISLSSGALAGGLAVDHLGVSSAMLVGGVFALAMAAVIWLRGQDDGAPSTVKLQAVH